MQYFGLATFVLMCAFGIWDFVFERPYQRKKLAKEIADRLRDRLVIVQDTCPKCGFELDKERVKKAFELLDSESGVGH